MNVRFKLPEHAHILSTLSRISEDYIVGGSVAYHLYFSPEEPKSFKDLDIIVGSKFLESAKSKYPNLLDLMDAGSFMETNFDEMGMFSHPRRRHIVGGNEYPAKFWMFIRGVGVDSFVCELDKFPFVEAKVKELKVRLVAPRHALRITESIITAKAMTEKNPSLEERRDRLKALIDIG